MKHIFLACNPDQITKSLRESIAHLTQSCTIHTVHPTDNVIQEINARAFDLFIIDFQLDHLDSLELIDAIHQLDPGVPIILMLNPAHKTMRYMAPYLDVHPITRPFDSLTFLRLIDRLLHQQLNRYRQLSHDLTGILDTLYVQTGAACAFLTDTTGQILASTGDTTSASLDILAYLTTTSNALDDGAKQKLHHDDTIRHHLDALDQPNLYITPVLDDLSLVLCLPLVADFQADADIWYWTHTAADNAHIVLETYYQQELPTPDHSETLFSLDLTLSWINWDIITAPPSHSHRAPSIKKPASVQHRLGSYCRLAA